MSAWLDSAVQRVGDWLVEAGQWVGSIPDGVIGAVIGVIAAQIVTSVSTYRRRRDQYRAPQRAAIGALLAAANELKVSITEAIERSGISDRPTSGDAALETQNNFLSRLRGLGQAFEIAFLTVVDGPCYDQLVAAEETYEALKKLAKNPPPSRTDTASGFAAFMQKLGTASDDLDADLGYLVELAQKRLRTSRRLLSKRPTATRAPSGTPSIENGDRLSPSATQAAQLLSPTKQSMRERTTPTEGLSEVNADAHPPQGEDDVGLVEDVSPPPPEGEAAQQESAKSRTMYGQKRVPATSIKPGDRVFWTKDGVDLMLVVGTVTPAKDTGMPCLRFSGMTYALSPGAVGEALSGTERGQAGWTIPESNMVWKSVPWAEAAHGATGAGVEG